ncbi:hypothetical protein B484DRAFT_408647, partial [Ochromonadaceae sp. CCMP2298]
MRSSITSWLLLVMVVALWSPSSVQGAVLLTSSMPAQEKSGSFYALLQQKNQKMQNKMKRELGESEEDEGASALSAKEVMPSSPAVENPISLWQRILGVGGEVFDHLRAGARQVHRQGSGVNGAETGKVADALGPTGLTSDNARVRATVTRTAPESLPVSDPSVVANGKKKKDSSSDSISSDSSDSSSDSSGSSESSSSSGSSSSSSSESSSDENSAGPTSRQPSRAPSRSPSRSPTR